ncbi:hypothetical protein KUTeg_020815 [Tegillarca granosa]|uniref:Uncharacterized protein n=1 Tax=Tegillarca granosa TaxID=220873 RepID=A0ABQ9EF09_TEGGR|nr:hypothetical protein KUTeg_020815 [Tegillarca granosa]
MSAIPYTAIQDRQTQPYRIDRWSRSGICNVSNTLPSHTRQTDPAIQDRQMVQIRSGICNVSNTLHTHTGQTDPAIQDRQMVKIRYLQCQQYLTQPYKTDRPSHTG